MSKQGLELLQHAIRSGSVAALAQISDTASEKWIVQILPIAVQHEGKRAITAELRKGKPGPIDSLVESAASVRVMTRVKWAEVSFQTIVLAQQRRMLGRRVILQMPDPRRIEVEQRRRTAREPVPHTVRMQASIARCGDSAVAQARHAPTPGTQIAADVLDLSWTGIRVCCRADQLPGDIDRGEFMSVMLAYNGNQQLLTARFRNREPAANGGVRVGLEFDPPPSQSLATAEPIRALIELLGELRLRRASEQFTAKTLGLKG
jgi:c-di-GMP-binding flagellar brake protein YcgR